METRDRVLVIGLDGATWDVLDPWIRDGTLPYLARLRERGSWGPLQSSVPPITAAAWSTFMTGKRPGKHGVYHFVNLFDDDDGEDGPELVSARSLKSPALWDVLGHCGRRAVLVNIPLTYPPRPVNGVMVTGLLTPSSAEVFTYPPELSREITDYQIDLERFIDKTPHVDSFDPELTAPSLELVAEFHAMEERRARLCRELMERELWDFFMVVFTATDRMGHYLWPFHRAPRPDDPPDVRRLCEAVRGFYVRLDEIVGELVALAGPRAAVLVMSDHGMGPTFTRRFHCNSWLRRNGWLVERSGPSLASPDGWLRRLGLPRDKLGRLIRRIPWLAQSRVVKRAANSRSAEVDVERSAATCVPLFYNIVGVRVHREGAVREALCAEIIRGLQALRDSETGAPVAREVLRAGEYFSGPHAENLPDIIAILDPDYGCSLHLSHYSSDVTRRVEVDGPAKHRSEGIFLAAGPGITASAAPRPGLRIEDVAPTALHLLGLPVPSDMDGRALAEILVPTEAAPQAGEPTGFWPEAAVVFSDTTMTEEDEDVIRGRLKALGYFE
jgi:predicted AlkP superfamily phosphohydrolase/phosphomutase